MTKAISNRNTCLIKSVLLLCDHGHFSLGLMTKDRFFFNLIVQGFGQLVFRCFPGRYSNFILKGRI